MGSYVIRCVLGFSTNYSNPLTQSLEEHASTMDASYREGYLHWLTALSTLHDAVDAGLAGDSAAAARHLLTGCGQLGFCNDSLTTLGHALVQVRTELFESDVDPSEPLLIREPFFATLDYDGLYRELAGQGAVLPHRAYWDEAASRIRDGGARGGCRLLERHLRELQSDLHAFIADVEAAGRLPLHAMADALHGASLAVSRVMIGYTRLITTFGYVSLLCERVMHAHEQLAARHDTVPALIAS